MTKKQLSSSLLLAATVLGLASSLPVFAEEGGQTEATTIQEVTKSLPDIAVSVATSMREGNRFMDCIVELSEGYTEDELVATARLKDASGNVINSVMYPFYKGGTYFACWFIMDGQPAGTYTVEVSVSLPNTSTTFYGSSTPLNYTPTSVSAQPSSPQEKEQSSSAEVAVTASSGIVEQPAPAQVAERENPQDTVATKAATEKTSTTQAQERTKAPTTQKQAATLATRSKETKSKSLPLALAASSFLGVSVVGGLLYFLKKIK